MGDDADDGAPDTGVWAVLAQHGPWLLAHARRKYPGEHYAEDAAHDALLRALTVPQLEASRVRGLLVRLLHQAVGDRRRAATRQARLAGHAGLHDRSQTGPEEEVCDRADGAWLLAQADLLRHRERQALLHRVDGHPSEVIAELLSTSPAAVDAAVYRARRALSRVHHEEHHGPVPRPRRPGRHPGQ